MTRRSQAVRIPKEYRFACNEVLIERDGHRVILTPRPKSRREFFARAARFTEDYSDEIAIAHSSRERAFHDAFDAGLQHLCSRNQAQRT